MDTLHASAHTLSHVCDRRINQTPLVYACSYVHSAGLQRSVSILKYANTPSSAELPVGIHRHGQDNRIDMTVD